MKLLHYPDPSLTAPCQPVTTFDEELITTIEMMKTLMEVHKGIGLAANQVGVNKRIFLVKDRKGTIHHFINPTILETNGQARLTEGCLSAPGIFLDISRPESVMVEFQDHTGQKQKIMAEGIEARTILHEYDHLDGKFYFEKVNRQIRKAALKRLKK